MNKTVKYILLVVFIGICVFVRWKCTQNNLGVINNTRTDYELSDYIDTSEKVNLLSDAIFFKCENSVLVGDVTVLNMDKDRNVISNYTYTPIKGAIYDPILYHKPNTIVCLSSVYVGYLAALGLEGKIVGVDNLDYISNEKVRNNPNIVEVGNLGQLNMEALLRLNPKYVFVDDFDVEEGLSKKLLEAGILLVRCNPFREETPLARAEWIKFFGVLFNEYEKACSLFEDTKFNYNLLKKEAENYASKPTVFLNAPYGEQWTIPGGNSFQARLMKDAGARYIIANDTSSMTIHTGFEKMLVAAKTADYWLHLGTVSTKQAFLETNSNFDKFNAFKSGNLYNNNKNTNQDGGIPYWETSGVYPDWVLSDLVHIFHPEKSGNHKFHYYQKLK